MRELKFRAWKMHNGKLRRCVFSPFDILDYAHRHPEAPVLHNQDVNDIRDFMPDADVIEQYTGLKDKNGKEIYEGDIVVNTYYDDNEMYKVLWVDDSVAFGMESLEDMELYKLPLESLKVIGNIHENPELLNKKEEE